MTTTDPRRWIQETLRWFIVMMTLAIVGSVRPASAQAPNLEGPWTCAVFPSTLALRTTDIVVGFRFEQSASLEVQDVLSVTFGGGVTVDTSGSTVSLNGQAMAGWTVFIDTFPGVDPPPALVPLVALTLQPRTIQAGDVISITARITPIATDQPFAVGATCRASGNFGGGESGLLIGFTNESGPEGPPGPIGPAGPAGPPGPGANQPGSALLKALAGPGSAAPTAPDGYALVGIFKLEKPTGESSWFAVYLRAS